MTDLRDARSAQVRKILESRTFRNTEVLKRLLDYLGRRAIESPAEETKEYTVGLEAFGKPADYDPQTDSSVRVQAGKLRQKLDEYYRTEGAGDAVLIELPKGHFRLEFRPTAHPPEPSPAPAPAPPRRPIPWVGIGAALLLAGLGAYILIPRPTGTITAFRDVWTPEMDELWKPFLASPRPIMLAIGTPLFSKLGNSFFRDPALNTWDAASQSDEVHSLEKALGKTLNTAAFPYTGVGEAAGALSLERLLLLRGKDPVLQVSNLLSWEDISRNNMIFLGPAKYNLQISDLPAQQDFEISHSRVQNLRPREGEPRAFDEKWSADRTHLEEGHALISRLPGLHQTGLMLTLAGSSTECTRAAVEFMTRPEYVTPFVSWMRSQPGGVPQWFQVVVRAKFKSQTPIAIERVAFHALR